MTDYPSNVFPALRPVHGVEILDDSITALLIVFGLSCRFVTNRWIIVSKDGRWRAHIQHGASFEEWHAAVTDIVRASNGE